MSTSKKYEYFTETIIEPQTDIYNPGVDATNNPHEYKCDHEHVVIAVIDGGMSARSIYYSDDFIGGVAKINQNLYPRISPFVQYNTGDRSDAIDLESIKVSLREEDWKPKGWHKCNFYCRYLQGGTGYGLLILCRREIPD